MWTGEQQRRFVFCGSDMSVLRGGRVQAVSNPVTTYGLDMRIAGQTEQNGVGSCPVGWHFLSGSCQTGRLDV